MRCKSEKFEIFESNSEEKKENVAEMDYKIWLLSVFA